ncbi:hypothetical protein [Prolixibacter denitrificans]|uniref:TonB-dependent receptor-like protein n=1 Tax=Prolixibacter denitrificans TaxID=1541063 RepID=A0A2P8CDU4_9BACT|nr:hypothetical protein [Prolixibacter denitrificans]PSK83153.1 hypothetical protein CLV93_10483 [Prolixibacter denitrificans]GET21964.1 hypothetical protein JCM18694_22100 [Prolixibacter denitrificans]
MKKLLFLSTFLFLSVIATGQVKRIAEQFPITNIKSTELKAADFRPQKVKTAYDLALNLSYIHHISNGLKDKYLTLPLVIIDGKPVSEKELKKLSLDRIRDYDFQSGVIATALYGSRGTYGILKIVLKE